MPRITCSRIRTRIPRGNGDSDASSTFESRLGLTMPFRPSASSVSRATVAALTPLVMRMFATAPKPDSTGPGAEEIYVDARWSEFVLQAFSERLDVGLGGCVMSGPRHPLKAHERARDPSALNSVMRRTGSTRGHLNWIIDIIQ